jgi:hypothetical protein
MSGIGTAEDKKVGSKVVLGNGYTAYVENTSSGKRWVIRDANGKIPPNAPPNHKYLSDAQSYYNQNLKPQQQPKPKTPIEQAKEKNEAAFTEKAQAITDLKDDRHTFKALLDAANAKAYEHNLENPEDRISLVSIIHKWRTDPKTMPPSVKELIGYDKEGQKKLTALMEAAKQEAETTGASVDEVLAKWSKERPEGFKDVDFGDLSEGTLQERIEALGPELSDSKYVDLVLQGLSEENKYDFLNKLNEKQEARRKHFDTLQDRVEEDNAAELEFMTQPGGLYESIWGSIPEDERSSVSPQDLSRMGAMEDLGKYKGQSFGHADLLAGSMPQASPEFNWGDQPTYGKAKGLWDEISPNYTYGSAAPYDQQEHLLAAQGHAKGSSSLEGNEVAKQRAMRREDLENIGLIHNMLLREHAAKGDTVGYLDRLAEASRRGYQSPIETEGKIMGDAFDRQNEKRYKDNVFQKDLAQGGMNLESAELGEAASLHDLLEKDRLNKLATNEGLANQINQLKMLAADNKIQEAATSAEYETLRQNLWAQKKQIELAFRNQGMQEEALELQKAANEQEFISKIVSFGAKAIAAVGLSIATGNPAVGIAMFAPEAASLFTQTKSGPGMGQQTPQGQFDPLTTGKL